MEFDFGIFQKQLKETQKTFQQRIQQREKDVQQLRETVESHKLRDKLEDFYNEELKKISDSVTFTNIVLWTRKDFLQYSHQLTLDLNTVNKLLRLSENNRKQLKETQKTFQQRIQQREKDVQQLRETVESHKLRDKLEDFCKEELKKISDSVTFTNIVPRTRKDFLQYSLQLTLDLNTKQLKETQKTFQQRIQQREKDVQQLRETVESHKKQLKETQKTFQQRIQQREKDVQQLRETVESYKKQLKETQKTFQQRIQQREKDVQQLRETVESYKKQLKETQKTFQQRIQQREKDVQQLREAVKSHKRSAQTAVEDSERIFTELIRSIERSRSELIRLIRDREKAAVSRAEGRLERLEQEINDLRRRDAELEQLSHTQDHIQFLQSFQSLSAPPESTDVNEDLFSSLFSFDVLRESVHQLRDKLEDFCKDELKKISDRVTFTNIVPRTRKDFLQYSHQLTLDLNTKQLKEMQKTFQQRIQQREKDVQQLRETVESHKTQSIPVLSTHSGEEGGRNQDKDGVAADIWGLTYGDRTGGFEGADGGPVELSIVADSRNLGTVAATSIIGEAKVPED
ncbi:hypothetical protein Q8A67_021097 [Cirrhinus molitorella]|uniref:TRIM8/14/16/25/29/45/65 coiled-coil region domain-containing protein n=1 Tax=Cirrhinus molitorella TaxID=172907 RepID=A0AA88PD19_9TELE|nr:hypothetical protein Q8A67_021097 [Cirrhinus molitorella]